MVLQHPRNTVLIIGFQAEGTLGRRIVERQPTLRIYGEDVSLRAQVEVIDGYSAHARLHRACLVVGGCGQCQVTRD